jgi:hypothetical protein
VSPAQTEPRPSQPFILRRWREPLGGHAGKWLGAVRHLRSGELAHFRDWAALVALLRRFAPEAPPRA